MLNRTGVVVDAEPYRIIGSRVAAPIDRTLVVQRASDVAPEKIEWIWPGRIAVGKLTLIGGSPGLGKSQITTFLAATVSRGGDWPCAEGQAPVGSTILLSAEDGLQDTIVPRLEAANANLMRVFVVASVAGRNGSARRMFNLKEDLSLLESKISELETVRLVIIDPISAYMGGADGNGNVETRDILEPLSELAGRLRTAVVAVTHLNKGGGAAKQSALHRFVGSIAFAAAARTAFMVVKDADDEENRFFLHVKSNLGPRCPGLSFRSQQIELENDVKAPMIVWGTEHVSQSADDALAAVEGGANEHSAKNAAIEFLRVVLANGPVPVAEVQRQAIEAGLLQKGKLFGQSKPFRLARQALGIEPKRFGGGWILELPNRDTALSEHRDVLVPETNASATDASIAPAATSSRLNSDPALPRDEDTQVLRSARTSVVTIGNQ
jgi:putative DNA primase/helicase